MFGNVVNNRQFRDLVENGIVEIRPFELKRLKTIHYPLFPEIILGIEGVDESNVVKFNIKHNFDIGSKHYSFQPKEYLIVRVQEFLSLKSGIVGHFLPSSEIIDRGFVLSCGRVEYPFGSQKNQKLQFGLLNTLDRANAISSETPLAWLYLIDLRGLNNLENFLSDADLTRLARKMLRMRKADDDGVAYTDED